MHDGPGGADEVIAVGIYFDAGGHSIGQPLRGEMQRSHHGAVGLHFRRRGAIAAVHQEIAGGWVDGQAACVDVEQTAHVDLCAGQRTPRSGAIANEDAALLRAALARLPEQAQQVIKLRSWEQLSFPEIGEKMDRSAEAARKLWSRAVEQLTRELEQDGSDE